MLSIIDRYVIRQVLMPFLLGLLVFTFIFIIPVMMEYAEQLVAKGVSAGIVASLMVRLIPQALALTLPMSLLLALLVAFGRLSADREFVALQACGVSLLRLLRPVGLISLTAWAATSYVLIVGVPDANQSFRQIAFNVTADRAEGEVKPRVFFTEFGNMVLYAREVPPTGSGWDGVFLADMRDPQRTGIYLARHGHVTIDREAQRVDLVLEDTTRHMTEADGRYDVGRFERAVISVDAGSIFGGAIPKGLKEMTIAELREQISRNESTIDASTGRPVSTHNEWMHIHQKFSIPVACLVFGLIGLALGATHRRDGTLGSFVLGILVVFAYYVPLYVGPSLVKSGYIPPWLGSWLANIVLGALGVMMFVWRDRVADQPIRVPMPAWLQRRSGGGMMPGAGVLRLLDRYVAASYGRFLLLSVISLVAIFYISTFIDHSDKVFKGTASWATLLQYFRYATPQWVYYALPVSVLLSTLVTIAVLTKNSELIVMKACGISLYRVALPMFVTAALVGGLLFTLEETVLGPSNRRAAQLRNIIRGGSPETFDVLHRRWLVGQEGEIYHYDWYDPRNHLLSALSVYEFSPGMGRITRRTYANLATYMETGEEDPLDVWRVDAGWTREFGEDDKGRPIVRTFAPFTSDVRRLETTSYFGTEEPRPEFMGYTGLREHTKQLEASGFDVVAQRVALARKLAFPFVTVVMTLIAVPFAVTIGRSGAMGGIAVGIGLAITYWTVISVFAAIGTGGALPPVLAAWAPNLLFASGAAYLLLTVKT
jgi:LPS export ABC transporter permease LptF/LPS export ABC transporter permease LptG